MTVEDTILHSITCEIHRLILRPCEKGETSFIEGSNLTDSIRKEDTSTMFQVVQKRFPYLKHEFIMDELYKYME